MAYDQARGVVVLYGGQIGFFYSDTWEWDGTDWTQRFPLNNPGLRSDHAMAYDSLRNRTVLFAGVDWDRGCVGDTWEWDGINWTQRVSSNMRCLHAMTFDQARGRCVVFGGNINPPSGETWEYYPIYPASTASFGTGCAGTAGTPLLAAAPEQLPWLGDAFKQVASNLLPLAPAAMLLGVSNSTWSGLMLPFDLSIIGMPTCAMLASGELSLPMLNVGSTAEVTLNIPTQTSLLGAVFYSQGVAIDLGANALGVTVSNAAASTVGGR